MSAALCPQVRQSRLRDPEGTEQVGLQLVAELLLADLLDHPELAVAGVVDDDVEPAEVLVRPGDRVERRGPVGDVELQGEDGVAVLLDEVPEAADVAGGGGHPVAALEGCDRPLPAEAAGGSGDEPGLHEASSRRVSEASQRASAVAGFRA